MMTRIAVALGATLLAGAGWGETVNFDNLSPGAPPPGWTATKTGSGNPKWTVERDDSAPSKPNVLRQSGQATHPVCIKDDTSLKDGFVEVKFKPISGKIKPAVLCGVPKIRTTITSRARMPSKTTSRFITPSTVAGRRKSATI
jgi:hypothetical protein